MSTISNLIMMAAVVEVPQHNQRMALGPRGIVGAYRDVGSKLIRHATGLSKNMGFQGRIGGRSTSGTELFCLRLEFTKHTGLTDPMAMCIFN